MKGWRKYQIYIQKIKGNDNIDLCIPYIPKRTIEYRETNKYGWIKGNKQNSIHIILFMINYTLCKK